MLNRLDRMGSIRKHEIEREQCQVKDQCSIRQEEKPENAVLSPFLLISTARTGLERPFHNHARSPALFTALNLTSLERFFRAGLQPTSQPVGQVFRGNNQITDQMARILSDPDQHIEVPE